ncbi:MAG: S41 family peptidase [Lentisphaerae bacterium]|nr:S41 family peptidase [Lentisphaerota bacterium]
MSAKAIGRKVAWLVFLSLLGWNLVVGARIASKSDAEKESPDVAFDKMRQLSIVLVQIRENYVDVEKTGYKDLLYGALRGMLTSLDPHSQFMDPDMFKDMKEETAGEFGGLGIVIGMRDGILTVIAPMEDTPAFRAGILHGDKIIEINGDSTENLPLHEAVRKMRGEPGTRVKLKILRPKPQGVKELDLVRAVIKVESVKGAKILDDHIGYIRLTQFSEPTAETMMKALARLKEQGMTALILDLRNNPGGLLNSSVDVTHAFLPDNDIVVSTKSRREVLNKYRSRGRGPYADLPMVILVNGGSASASEIVAGALQDYKRAILLGEKTFGKGSVQSVLPFEDGSAIRLTTAKYYTPNDRCIHEIGIPPDIFVPVSPELWQKIQLKRAKAELGEPDEEEPPPDMDLSNVVDVQLERAVDVLKGIRQFKPQTAGK